MRLTLTKAKIRQYMPCRGGLKQFLPMLGSADETTPLCFYDVCFADLEAEHKVWALAIAAEGNTAAQAAMLAALKADVAPLLGMAGSEISTLRYWLAEAETFAPDKRLPSWADAFHNAVYAVVRNSEVLHHAQDDVLEDRFEALDGWYDILLATLLAALEGVPE